MPVTSDKPAPYAAPQSIVELIERHRNRGLPSPVNAEVLARAGIPDSLIARTIQTLQTLDLIDEGGQLTDAFERIRAAPEAEYQVRLQEWLNHAYADILAYADPASDDESKIRDAFRNYKPYGQHARMVTLFVRLFAAAGIQAPKAVTAKPATRPMRVIQANRPRLPTVRKPVGGNAAAMAPKRQVSGLPAPIEGLLQSLPAEGEGWTKDRRDKFLQTFGAVVDFCFPIVGTALVVTDSADKNGG